MQQLLDDNKTLFTENEELKKALNSQLHKSSDSGLALKRRKRDTGKQPQLLQQTLPALPLYIKLLAVVGIGCSFVCNHEPIFWPVVIEQ